MIVRARFTAEVGPAERTAEVIGERGQYEVFVSSEASSIMARVLETRDMQEALRVARGWMDSIDLQGRDHDGAGHDGDGAEPEPAPARAG